MIGQLRGKILHKQAPELTIDVNGVGYECIASMTTFIDLPNDDTEITLFTHLSVREDAHTLFAFNSIKERALFRTLLKVNGVGPKLALAIVSSMSSVEFATLVHANDITGLTKLPGVGKKTAERLIIEMRDRIEAPSSMEQNTETQTKQSPLLLEQEAVTALIALGYKPTQASQMISKCDTTNSSVEEIVHKALKDSLL